jgi:putative IMPACT (imprinted ancient) family translation regulator
VRLRVTVGYADVDGVRRLAVERDATVESERFEAEVTFVVGVPSPALATFEDALAELTQGRARVAAAELP